MVLFVGIMELPDFFNCLQKYSDSLLFLSLQLYLFLRFMLSYC